jgi:hypothetical protein
MQDHTMDKPPKKKSTRSQLVQPSTLIDLARIFLTLSVYIIQQAAAGWPLAELWGRSLAKAVDAQPVVYAADRNFNAMNGGLGKVDPRYWAAISTAAAFVNL